MTHLLPLFLVFFVTSCAIGPVSNQETARSVGKDNHELMAGYGNSGYTFKWNYGLTEKLDVGLHTESFSLGIRGKYSLIKENDKGFSLALALGAGDSFGGNHYYGDLIGSYLTGKWEPYSSLRVVRVNTDEMDFKSEDTGAFSFKVQKNHYSYGQYFLGTRYWFSPKWLVSLEASAIFSLTAVDVSEHFIVNGALGYRF